MPYLKRYLLWLSCLCIISPTLSAQTLIKSIPMQIHAEIQSGCVLNGSKASGAMLGTIQFGALVLNQALGAASAESTGSLILSCTPGTAISIALNAGDYADNIPTRRQLKHRQKNVRLPYQLYQDSGYKTVWGEGNHSRTVTATGGQDVLTVYAKLLPMAIFPPAGDYQDSVTVTINY